MARARKFCETHDMTRETPSSLTEQSKASGKKHLPLADVTLNRDLFFRTLLRELSGTLEDVVGLEEASGFISVVGQNIGRWLNGEYRAALGGRGMNRAEVAEVLVDLKHRIGGDFFIIEQNDEKIVLGSHTCPFGAHVRERPSLCAMTSNVFGHITAENLGYARIVLEESISSGATCCRVMIYLEPTDDATAAEGREYFGGTEDA